MYWIIVDIVACVRHIRVNPGGWICVKNISFIKVGVPFCHWHIQRWLARQSPSCDVRVDKMASPWGTVARHEEANRRIQVFDQTVFMYMPQVIEHVDDATLMHQTDISGNDNIGHHKVG